MNKLWALAGIGMVIGNMGCYYDQWQAAERARRTLEQQNTQLKTDLHDCEFMLRQKETELSSLNNQLSAKDQTIASMSAENENLRNALDQALKTLEGNTAIPSGPVVVTQALPEPLHQELQRLAEQYPDQIEYDPAKGAVRWKSDLLFPLGSDELTDKSASIDAMSRFAEIVQSNVALGFDVIVVGHTDTTPIRKPETLARFRDNWYLSAARAIAVMKILAEQGVGKTRMGIMGYGEYRPIADNSSAEGKAKNRRVEIYLVPKDSVQSVSQGVYQSPDTGIAFVRPDELSNDS